jgi:hypothetical protein
MTPLFIATQRFDPSDGEKWRKYAEWAKIPNLVEVVSLDGILCPHLINERDDRDWEHIVIENFRLDYFYDLDYLMDRIRGVTRRNVLGLYRNPEKHIDCAPASGAFDFMGHDLIEDMTQISALTNCGGSPESFSNDELNPYGLITDFVRASEVRHSLKANNPDEPHANCELYAIWRLVES